MTRPSYLAIDKEALQHNVARIKHYAPQQHILAMVKANAYGCGLHLVAPILAPLVESFGVACIEEAAALRQVCPESDCVLLQGIFSPDEVSTVIDLRVIPVIHNPQQLAWFTTTPMSVPLKVWVKVDTGMHRLGFAPHEIPGVLQTLKLCPWIDEQIGLMTHLGCADTPDSTVCQQQLKHWQDLSIRYHAMKQSVANSAAIIALPQTHANMIRPGLILYGVSPFEDRLGAEFDLQPVMHFLSSITTIHQYSAGEAIGYGATWRCERSSVIGVIPVGYGDGYPRHIQSGTCVWVNGHRVPIVGRVSMDMMTVDLTDCPQIKIGDRVELWGKHMPVEIVAKQSNTIAYELMTQVSQRVVRQYYSETRSK
ncbi:MAG: alanine racemase [Legionella sp.]|nr:MAG: alanine racemase [Legionella sp.]